MTDKEILIKVRDKVEKLKKDLPKNRGYKRNAYNHVLSIIDSMQKELIRIKKGCKYRCLSDMQNTDTGAISFFKDKIYSAPEDNTLVSEENGWLCDISENSSNFELVEEPVSEDLEEAADSYIKTHGEILGFGRQTFKAGAEWQQQKDKKWLANNHTQIFNNGYEEGFEAGRDDMEEQMMAKAVDAVG